MCATRTDGAGKGGKVRAFNMANYAQRKIALRVAYLGHQYSGLAAQDHDDNTIEQHLLAALQKTRLIVDRESCGFSRCGRTDKGVSAFGQVVALSVRSNYPRNKTADGRIAHTEHIDDEIQYVSTVNRVLPDDIRATGWAPVPDEFDARFSCVQRSYKYFFLGAGYDTDAMHTAAKLLEGEHDFRNFCKMDILATRHFRRRVLSAAVVPSPHLPGLYEFQVTGTAFLWHQVRLMVAVLFMVGQRLEEPSVVSRLLDIVQTPARPSYVMASEFPLVLYDCKFDGLEFYRDGLAEHRLADHFSRLFGERLVHAGLLRCLSDALAVPMRSQGRPHEPRTTPHIPLAQRQTERTLDERIGALQGNKKRKYEELHEAREDRDADGE